MLELQRELFYIVKETTATKIKEHLNRPRWPPEVAKRLDATGDDENPSRSNGSFHCSFESPVILLHTPLHPAASAFVSYG